MTLRWLLTTLAGALALSATMGLAAGDADGDDDVEGGTIGTGIMGEITGLGSIHVGGARIILPPDLQVTALLGSRPASALRVGETVIVEAAQEGDALVAFSLRNYYPLVGPVEVVSGDTLRVLGRTLDVADLEIPDLATGDWVAVSGLWRGAEISVSHVRRITAQSRVIVNGTFTHGNDGEQRVGPFPLADAPVTHADTGAHLRVRGTWDPEAGQLVADRIDSGLFSTDLPSLRVEGYLSQPDATGTYFIYGSGIVFLTDTPGMRVPEERTIFCVSPVAPASFTELLALDLPRSDRLRLLETRARSSDTDGC